MKDAISIKNNAFTDLKKLRCIKAQYQMSDVSNDSVEKHINHFRL